MIARYAGESGDYAPVHVDEEFTTDAGYESVFAMGRFTAGVAGPLVNQWLGIENVREFSVRFEDIVYPSDEIKFQAEIAEETDGSVTADLTDQPGGGRRPHRRHDSRGTVNGLTPPGQTHHPKGSTATSTRCPLSTRGRRYLCVIA